MESLFGSLLIELFILYQICQVSFTEFINETENDPLELFQVFDDENNNTVTENTIEANNKTEAQNITEAYNQTKINNHTEELNETQANSPVQRALHAPYQAHIIVDANEGHIAVCCAVIVGPRTLISAAFCFDPKRYGLEENFPRGKIMEIYQAVAGVSSVDDQEKGQWRNLIEYVDSDEYIHEAHLIQNDIALLFIDGIWYFDEVVKMIPIARKDEDFTKRECQISMLKVTGEPDLYIPNSMMKNSHVVLGKNKFTNLSDSYQDYYYPELNDGKSSEISSMDRFVLPNETFSYDQEFTTDESKEKVTTVSPVGIEEVLTKVFILSTEACEAVLEDKGYYADSSQILCVTTEGNISIEWEYAGGPLVCYYPEYQETAELGLLVGILSETGFSKYSKSFFTKTSLYTDWIENVLLMKRYERASQLKDSDAEDDENHSNKLTGCLTNVLVLNVFLYKISLNM